MAPAQLKLRRDLRISRQETPGGISFVVKDPSTGQFFRLKEPAYFVAQQLDGATPVDVIRGRVEEKFGAPVTAKVVEQVVEILRRLRLLEEAGAEAEHTAPRGGRVRGDPLHVRLKAFDPDRLLDWLVGKVWFCFTPHFLVLSATLILFGLGVLVVNRDEIWREVPNLYRVNTVLLAWLITILVSAAHELTHGVTCKRFGGQVHEIGFMLLYFQPSLYCNVSDAWLFPEKSKRLWVTFAGAYFELLVWALAIVTWRVTEPGTGLGLLALIVIVTSGIKIFFNLNPLIKLDGYYLLSDALGISNLRAKAFGYLRAGIGRLWGAVRPAARPPSPRERRIYLVYGLLAGVYSFWLVGYVALWVGGFLTERYQGAGAIVFTGLLGAAFQSPLRRWAARPALLEASRRRLASVSRPVRVLLPLALILAALFLVRWELSVSDEFTIAPRHNADLRAAVDGIIAEIFLDEGERVTAGQLVALLADRDYRAELRKVEAEIEEKRAKFRMLKAGPRQEEIELARQAVASAKTASDHTRRWHEEARKMHAARLSRATTDLAKAEERLKYGRSEVQRFRRLFDDALVARKDFEQAEELGAVREKEMEAARAEQRLVLADDLGEVRKEVVGAQKELEESKGRLALLLAGSRLEEIQAAEAELARLEAQRSFLAGQLDLVAVVSPIAGVITTPKLKEKLGQYVKKGDLILEVHEFEVIKAEIAVPEREMGDVKVGQPVVIKARAFPEKSFVGRVTAIAPAAVKVEEGWRGKVFRVTTAIDNPELLLKPEMTGNAKIFCGERRIVEILTRRLARYIRVEFWSWW